VQSTTILTNAIKTEALRLGFASVGIAKAEKLVEDEPHLKNWLENGYHASMQYMENHFEKRLDPSKLVEGAKSVIVLTHNYFPQEELPAKKYKIARYAYGNDYHDVLKEKMKLLLTFIKNQLGEVNARIFTDSAPVLERSWAVKAGLGWQGKNTLLLQKGLGSYFFIAEIITDLELEYDTPFKADHCGTCTRCIDACPTQALLPNKVLDANKCISYLTIENKAEIPVQFKNQWQDWIFGCDSCQDVCPWNNFSLPHGETAFLPNEYLVQFQRDDWENLDPVSFKKVFTNSPIERTKLKGIKRNVDFVK
jgi:epoxyqueuosine reductase